MEINRLRINRVIMICMVACVIIIGLVNGNPGGKSFLTVDPVPEKTVGDLVILSGTTNLAEETNLLIQIQNGGYNTGAKVIRGAGGVNRWSVPIDTSGIKPGEYIVKVTERKEQTGDSPKLVLGETANTTKLLLTGTYLGSDTPVTTEIPENAFINLDPVSMKNRGDQFLVTGKTNLPVGTDIIWEVNPANLEEMIGPATGSMANSQVTKGPDDNRVTYALDTVQLLPGEYNVTASTFKGEVYADDMVKGPVSSSGVIFTLK
ncbi:hypothetical protein [Methanospirillum lacunae]|uniref:DUF3821 domain-containing protein n=1 Tax=Methanospirillum lacunae TaxID=668570 RepID=A0A2V2N597_9EURY|nr:hypothetical protein [Methanospirillum lacunae]PWR71688.1 hypothetical protein DK846_12650 [Methanospirillum lacunae]